MKKLILAYKVLFKRTAPFDPPTMHKEDWAELLAAWLLTLTLLLYPLTYVILVLWRLTEPVRMWKKFSIEQLENSLKKP